MVINKKIPLFFLTISVLLVCLNAFIYFYFQKHPFTSTNTLLWKYFEYSSAISALDFALRIVQTAGVLWVLSVFKERWWIRIAVIVYLFCQATYFLFLFNRTFITSGHIELSLIFYINTFTLMYLLVAFLCIRENVIKTYLVIYAILWFCVVALQFIFSHPDPHSETVFFAIRDVLIKLPAVVLLVLFTDIYNIANNKGMVKQSGDV
jgi:hypothetical protein